MQSGGCSAHSDHGYYATGKEADGVESSFLTSLNGRWKFAYANNLAEVIEGFYRKDYDSSNWDEIMVPSSIQLFGYDKLQYVNSHQTGGITGPLTFLRSLEKECTYIATGLYFFGISLPQTASFLYSSHGYWEFTYCNLS